MKPAAPSAADDRELILRAQVSLPSSTKVTPMLRQWLQAKAKAPDAILLFRMGDFYELFGDDARRAGEVLALAVTTRDRDKSEDSMPMAGFPHPAAPGYIAKLIAAGLKVAVCDQLEDPALAKGIVRRDVTRLVTPGMVLDEESLEAKANNFLVAVVRAGVNGGDVDAGFGVAALDVSTGDFFCTLASGEAAVVDEVQRLAPREIVVDANFDAALVARLAHVRADDVPRRVETKERPRRAARVLRLGGHDALLDDPAWSAALLACELCLLYAEETGQGALPKHLRAPRAQQLDRRLLLDQTTRQHLDLTGPAHDLRKRGTLLWHLDRTKTAAGGRRLLRQLLEPSAHVEEIEARLDRLQVLVDDPALRAHLLEHLGGADVERLVARAANGRAGPRELVRLAQALRRFSPLAEALFAHPPWAALLAPLAAAIESASVVCAELSRALRDDAPGQLGDERAFVDGYDQGLDELWALQAGGQSAIAALEQKERELTGIGSLKIRFNNIFGWYVEVTKAHQAKVPERYRRKQTIANGERYITDELVALEEQVDGADGRRRRREGELFSRLLELVQTHARGLLEAAGFVADVDAAVALAEVAVAGRCVRPVLVPAAERTLVLEDVRHLVVERLCEERGEPYVPASLTLDGDRQVLIVTGPNMAGKSTLMRQVALAQVLAQCGCFVPAKHARLSLCDRVFTRVGASDDTASGRSTFMVEMTETAHILRGATPHSLVLLDEIGRGTSTYDGLAIAWAVAEHLHDVTGARTLFATHYHELTALADHLTHTKNVHVVVKEWGDDIVFVRTLEDGPAGRSFGIQVARLAGLPPLVVSRAKDVLAQLEGYPASSSSSSTSTSASSQASPKARPPKKLGPPATAPQLALFAPPQAVVVDDADHAVLERLRAVDVHRLTPLAAMNLLASLVDDARRR